MTTSKDQGKVQALSILKHSESKSKSANTTTNKPVKTKSQKIHAIYFPEDNEAIQWRYWDNEKSYWCNYEWKDKDDKARKDDLQMLEFEASYYSNIQANFPSDTNKLFKKKDGDTSLFDHCYQSRLSQLMKKVCHDDTREYCLRFASIIDDKGEQKIKMDQVRLNSQQFSRSAQRLIDRQKYVEIMSQKAVLNRALDRRVDSLSPIINTMETMEHEAIINSDSTLSERAMSPRVAWIATFDPKAVTKENKYEIHISSQFNRLKSTEFTNKEIETPVMTIMTVSIKEGELMTIQRGNYMWAIFNKQSRASFGKYCPHTFGHWDISFDTNEKEEVLRSHLEAILSSMKYPKIQEQLDIDKKQGYFGGVDDDENKNKDRMDETEKPRKKKAIHFTIDNKWEYKLLWYNTAPFGKAQAIRFKRKRKDTDKWPKKNEYVMYFPIPGKNINWQWYDNNEISWITYDQKEPLQLEASWLANKWENYPQEVTHKPEIRYFSHCILSTMHEKIKPSDKSFILRLSKHEEQANSCDAEQVAFHSNGTAFARTARRLTEKQLQRESAIIHQSSKSNLSPKHIPPPMAMNKTFSQEAKDKEEKEYKLIENRLVLIMKTHWKWTRLSETNEEKPKGFLHQLAKIYELENKNPKKAIVALQDEYDKWEGYVYQNDNPYKLREEVANRINDSIKDIHRGDQLDKCRSVQNQYRDRTNDADAGSKRYFGFTDSLEIITLQKLDSIHCELCHNYYPVRAVTGLTNAGTETTATSSLKTGTPTTPVTPSPREFTASSQRHSDDEDDEDDIKVESPWNSSLRVIDDGRSTRSTTILEAYSQKSSQKRLKKFKTSGIYDSGYRFFYWEFYRHNKNTMMYRKEEITEPGNQKENGGYHKLEDFYVKPMYKNLKEEILEFGTNFGALYGIAMNQWDTIEARGVDLQTQKIKRLKIVDDSLLDTYKLRFGDPIKLSHLLAVALWCNFTDMAAVFAETFKKCKPEETIEELKERHKKCAIWAKYLREAVEGYGRKNRRGGDGVRTFYRGITRRFLFKGTVLRFNSPTSTTINWNIAANFATGDFAAEKHKASGGEYGLILTLVPNWGAESGNIRSFECAAFSDFKGEGEYLFIGGLEKLVIENIKEARKGGLSYKSKLQAITQLHKLFRGGGCNERLKVHLMNEFIDQKIKYNKERKAKSQRSRPKQRDYCSMIFDFYCDDSKEIVIRLSLLEYSYKRIAHSFLDKKNQLKLDRIIELFPNCKKITIIDGEDIRLAPFEMPFKGTIFGTFIGKCLPFIRENNHPLKKIALEIDGKFTEELLSELDEKLDKFGWKYKLNIDDEEGIQVKYEIYR